MNVKDYLRIRCHIIKSIVRFAQPYFFLDSTLLEKNLIYGDLYFQLASPNYKKIIGKPGGRTQLFLDSDDLFGGDRGEVGEVES